MNHDCPTGRHLEPATGCYTHHRCRCDGCRGANRQSHADVRSVRLRLGLEQRRFTASEPTRARVALLIDQGAEQNWIAAAVGRSQPWVSELLSGRFVEVRRDTAARVERLARLVAQGDVQPPGFREAQARKLVRDRRRQYRVSA